MKYLKIYITILLLSIIPFSSSCGWFTYEDISDTRVYYNAYDEISVIEDSTLLMSRFPSNLEREKNVFIPMSYDDGGMK